VEPAKNIGGLDKHIQHFKYRLPRNRMCLRTPKIKIIISSYIKANCKRNLYELKAKIWLVSKSDTFGDYNIELANNFFLIKIENSANNPPRKAPKLSLSYVEPKKDASTCFL